MADPAPLNFWNEIREPLEEALPGYLLSHRWFGGKTRPISAVTVVDFLPVPRPEAPAAIVLARVAYAEGAAETYAVPLIECAKSDTAGGEEKPAAILTVTLRGDEQRTFRDALSDRMFLEIVFETLASAGRFTGTSGEYAGVPTSALETLRRAAAGHLEPSVMKAEQSNTSVLYGRTFVLKFFRHIEQGLNPDFEIGEFLMRRVGFSHVPPTAGAYEYRHPGAPVATAALLQGFVANQGDAWQHTLAILSAYFDRINHATTSSPEEAEQWLGDDVSSAGLLGCRTAELHLALTSAPDDPDFAPEPYTPSYQRGLQEAMSGLARETFAMLRRRAPDLPAALRSSAERVLEDEEQLLSRYHMLGERRLSGRLIRIHGDLHLGQVLWTGDDFVFIDFEGEPARSLAERRAKYSPIRDVAGMIRSFHYAAFAALFARLGEAGAAAPRFAALVPFANAWYRSVSGEFLRRYRETARGADFLPADSDEFNAVLELWLLDKAVYELKYELNHRLGWVAIPLEGITGLLAPAS